MAGRKNKIRVDYFPHYVRHGSKMSYLENKFGNDGYAVWFKIMEKLGSSDNHHIDLTKHINVVYLSTYCLVSEEVLIEIIEFLVMCGWAHEKLWKEARVLCSEEFIDNLQDAYSRRKNDCINIQGVELMYHINTQSKVEKRKEERDRDEKPHANQFLTIRQFYNEALKDQPWLEVVAMQNGHKDIENTKRLLRLFCNQLKADGLDGKTWMDGRSHFSRWSSYKKNKKLVIKEVAI